MTAPRTLPGLDDLLREVVDLQPAALALYEAAYDDGLPEAVVDELYDALSNLADCEASLRLAAAKAART